MNEPTTTQVVIRLLIGGFLVLIGGSAIACKLAGTNKETQQTAETDAAADTNVTTGDNSRVFVLTWQHASASAQYGGYGLLFLLWLRSAWLGRRAVHACDRLLLAIERANAANVKANVRMADHPNHLGGTERYIRDRLQRMARHAA